MSETPGEDTTPGPDCGAERTGELDRVLTFVDAAIAIALTLLVLPIAHRSTTMRSPALHGESITSSVFNAVTDVAVIAQRPRSVVVHMHYLSG